MTQLINSSFFQKTSFANFLENQFLDILLIMGFAIILTLDTTSPVIAVISIQILSLFSYVIHVLFHYFNNAYNPHTSLHHSGITITTDEWLYWIYLFIEFIVNVLFFVLIYILLQLIPYNFIPSILIIYYGMIYVSIHIINYSLFHMGNHSYHHQTPGGKIYNYGPDPWDHIFNTNYNDTFENMNHININTLICFLIVYGVQKMSK